MPVALEPSKVARIRAMLASGYRQCEVARIVGVSDQCVSSIRARGYKTGPSKDKPKNQWDVQKTDPTDDEIQERCAVIRSEWSAEERELRTPRPIEIQLVAVAVLRARRSVESHD